jgi:hypothetical protein
MSNRTVIDKETTVSTREIALLLHLTTRRIQQLVAEGVLPRLAKRGRHNLKDTVNAFSDYQRKQNMILRATGRKRQRKNKPLTQPEMEAWRERVDSELKQFSERLMQLRKQNDTSLDIELDMSEFQTKKGGTKHD